MRHYVFADGRQVRQVSAFDLSAWQLLTIDGEHVCYLQAEHVDYSTVRAPK